MTNRLSAFVFVVLVGAAVAQAPPQKLITRALEPSAEDLARLNLVVAWRIYAPVGSQGDSIATVQPFEDQVFVQLQSGTLLAIQAHENPKTFKRAGDVLWTMRPAQAPGVARPVAIGPKEVYLTLGQRLLILDRADGKVKYTEELPFSANNAPAIDETSIYIPLGNRRITAYSHVEKIPGHRPPKPYEAPDPVRRVSLIPEPGDALSTPQNRSPSIARLEILRPPFKRGMDSIDSVTSIGMLKNVRPPYREVDSSRSPSVVGLRNLRNIYELSEKESITRVKHLWELQAGGQLWDTPILTADPNDPESQRLTTYTGRNVFTSRREAARTNGIQTQYFTQAAITAPLSNYGDNIYVATADSNLVALSVADLREPSMVSSTLPRGKFTTGGPIQQKPLVTENALYVVAARWGLIRLKHGTLEPMWTERLSDGRIRARPNSDVVQLLSVNSSYAYGIDRGGRLLVIDAIRGSTLSSFDVSAFTLPLTNDATDRVYLAAGSGLLLCMHDTSRLKPEFLRKPPVAAPKKENPVIGEPKKEMPPMKEPEKKQLEKKEPEKK